MIDMSIFSDTGWRATSLALQRASADERNKAAAATYASLATGWQDEYVARGKAERPAPEPPYTIHVNDDGTETLGPDTVAPKVQPPVVNLAPPVAFTATDQMTRIEQKLDWVGRMLVELGKALAAK